MTALLQIGNQTLTAEEVVSKLSNCQIFPKFLREIILDEAIASYACTPEEEATMCEKFYAGYSEEQNQAWLDANGLTKDIVVQQIRKKIQINKFKEAKWGDLVKDYFFKERRHQLDRVVYSLICHKDYNVIQELYFRLTAKEQSFAELASQYSQSAEAKTKGVVGPIEVSQLPEHISNLLTAYPPKTVISTEFGEYYALIQLELLIPAKFDRSMRIRMIEELFEQWLQKEVGNLGGKTDVIQLPSDY